jgi:hypothetical protein
MIRLFRQAVSAGPAVGPSVDVIRSLPMGLMTYVPSYLSSFLKLRYAANPSFRPIVRGVSSDELKRSNQNLSRHRTPWRTEECRVGTGLIKFRILGDFLQWRGACDF